MTQWEYELAAWSRWARAGGLCPGTIRLRLYWLRRLARATQVGPYRITADQMAGWLGGLHVAPETRKSARASVRVFYGWAVLDGRTAVDPTMRLRPVRVPPTMPRPTPDAVMDDLHTDGRTSLMVDLARQAGLRRAEIAALHTRDVTAEGLRITGKGGRVRIVPLVPALADRLAGMPAGFVFPSPRGGHLSADRVGRLLSAALGDGWAAHSLRHRFATRSYAGTGNLLAVQKLLGHASPVTTQRYTLVTDRELLAAVVAAS